MTRPIVIDRMTKLWMLCLFSAATEWISADEPVAKDMSESARMNRLLDRSVQPFRLAPVGERYQSVQSLPVLRWTNDVRDSHSLGVLVLWIDRGRPVAAVATYVWDGKIMHEFDSLAREQFSVQDESRVVWESKKELPYTPFPNAPEVDATEAGRLRQMKGMASQFAVTMLGWRRDLSDKELLRRMPRELYRYKPQSIDCLDGALFTFALGTDPEAILSIEAIKANDRTEWQYAFVRQTSGGLEARLNDQIVWQAEPHPIRNETTGQGRTIVSQLVISKELE